MDFADVRFCLRLSKRSRSYDEGSIELKIASAKPTLWASSAFAYAAFHLFELALASPSKMRLAWTKAEDVVGTTYLFEVPLAFFGYNA